MLCLGLICAVLAIARPSLATVGGPETLELVGWDAKDAKVYLLREFHDEGDGIPQLEYLLLSGPQAGQLIVAKSWDPKVTGDDEPKFRARLAVLRARLTPLPAIATSSLRLKTRRVRAIERQSYNRVDPPWKGSEIAVTLRRKGRIGQKRVEIFRDGIELVQAFELSNHRAIALIRYVGIPFELGYETDSAVLLR